MRRNQRLRQITKVYRPLKDLSGKKGFANYQVVFSNYLVIYYNGEKRQTLCPVCCDRLKWRTEKQKNSKNVLVLIKQVLPICKKGHKFLLEEVLLGDKIETKPKIKKSNKSL